MPPSSLRRALALATAAAAFRTAPSQPRASTRRRNTGSEGPEIEFASTPPGMENGIKPLDPALFDEKPPPSWGSPEWHWGSAEGAAHEKAALVRRQFEKRHRRTSFMAWAKCGTVDAGDLKMALALSCQRAKNLGYDAPDGRWAALEREMAAASFMDAPREFIDQPKLAAAVNERLETPFTFGDFMAAESEGTLEEYPGAVIARALEELAFVENGL
mmetsp:Transcript_28771/g.86176  ORF Transcript_28771/g.86176 Transcript_28771/m.86176 type:complete len:216 (-) Transcript_28771:15-662(-)